MTEALATEGVANRVAAKKALGWALVLVCVTPILPAVIWSIGRWVVIFIVSGVLSLVSLAVAVYSFRARRGGGRAWVALVLTSLTLVFWVFLTSVFVTLSRGGGE